MRIVTYQRTIADVVYYHPHSNKNSFRCTALPANINENIKKIYSYLTLPFAYETTGFIYTNLINYSFNFTSIVYIMFTREFRNAFLYKTCLDFYCVTLWNAFSQFVNITLFLNCVLFYLLRSRISVKPFEIILLYLTNILVYILHTEYNKYIPP
jgi:hypothetical protein